MQSNFIEIILRHGRSPVNLLLIFRTPFPKNTSEGLLLVVAASVFHFKYLTRISRFKMRELTSEEMLRKISIRSWRSWMFVLDVLPHGSLQKFLSLSSQDIISKCYIFVYNFLIKTTEAVQVLFSSGFTF